MSPVNFDALYQHHLKQKQEEQGEATAATETAEITH
jgi:preprotein translocase subunit SecB